jgi:hypothetical protein
MFLVMYSVKNRDSIAEHFGTKGETHKTDFFDSNSYRETDEYRFSKVLIDVNI